MIFGTGPVDNDLAVEEFGAILFLIAQRIDLFTSQLESIKSAESPVLSGIAALRLLVDAHPGPARIMIRRDQVEGWRNRYFSWLDRVQSKIPAKFRDGIRETATREFDLLLQRV